MRRHADDVEDEKELDSPSRKASAEEGKKKRGEGVEKRKALKQKDKIARWSGFILLLLVLIFGFMLWVAGEMGV